ncbi:Alpha-1 3/1 6-mannosyltransferase alg-2 [Mortierella sp. AD094]|nr:Alpha-1 3/1 6-mannosyltransferase alg-2 [Mortierella sp. AD094]
METVVVSSSPIYHRYQLIQYQPFQYQQTQPQLIQHRPIQSQSNQHQSIQRVEAVEEQGYYQLSQNDQPIQYPQYSGSSDFKLIQRNTTSTPQKPESSLRRLFDSADIDGSGRLNTERLLEALRNDVSGQIGFAEFSELWTCIEKWRVCFMEYDPNNHGFIVLVELKNAMRSLDYNLSDEILGLLANKYDETGRGELTLNIFLQIVVAVKGSTDAFNRIDHRDIGVTKVDYEQFLEHNINIKQ